MASRTSTQLLHPDRDALVFTVVLAALSDPLRLGIVAELAGGGERPCSSFELPVSKSTQSWHFRTLREAGVIRQRDEGTRRLNSLRTDDLEARFPGLLALAVREGAAPARPEGPPGPAAARPGESNLPPVRPSV